MKNSSITKEALRIDPEITSRQRKLIMDVLDGKPRPEPKSSEEKAVLLSQKQAAKLLGMSRSTVWRMTRAGQLTTVEVNGRARYRRIDLEQLAGLR